jgi:hypothetical protein
MTADVVVAYVRNNSLATNDLPEVISMVHASLTDIGRDDGAAKAPLQPAVPIRRSVTPDYIVCLEDGKKLKMLKRHLRTSFNDARRVPDQVAARPGLSHGGAELRQTAFGIRQADRPGPEVAAQARRQAGLGKDIGSRGRRHRRRGPESAWPLSGGFAARGIAHDRYLGIARNIHRRHFHEKTPTWVNSTIF